TRNFQTVKKQQEYLTETQLTKQMKVFVKIIITITNARDETLHGSYTSLNLSQK
ncbi:hypothetical protein WA026_018017, partial [Henosepilachna vigintioctopunctata]